MENGVAVEYIAVAKSFHNLSYLVNNKLINILLKSYLVCKKKNLFSKLYTYTKYLFIFLLI